MILYKLPSLKPILHASRFFNHYQTLNLHPNATDEQIKANFLSLAKKYHPDNALSHDHKDFLLIKEAYDVLKEPHSRKLYDLQNFP
jgi:molecular chaperone DnaJ